MFVFLLVYTSETCICKSSNSAKNCLVYLVFHTRKSGYECQFFFCFDLFGWLIGLLRHNSGWPWICYVLRMILSVCLLSLPSAWITGVHCYAWFNVSVCFTSDIYILFLIYDCKSLPGSNSSLLLVHFPESVYYNDKVWQPWSQAFSYVLALLLNSHTTSIELPHLCVLPRV